MSVLWCVSQLMQHVRVHGTVTGVVLLLSMEDY